MSQTDLEYVVDFTRGKRQYLRAVDILQRSPIDPSCGSFDLRFHRLASSPGFWTPANYALKGVNVFASLSIKCPNVTDEWKFVALPKTHLLIRRQNIESNWSMENIKPMRNDFATNIVDHGTFWDQVIDIGRAIQTRNGLGDEWVIHRIRLLECLSNRWPTNEPVNFSISKLRSTYFRVVVTGHNGFVASIVISSLKT